MNSMIKRRAIFSYLKRQKADIVLLQETYGSTNNDQQWLDDWGGSGVFAHGTKHSRGVAILFRDKLDIEIKYEKKDYKGRFIILKARILDKEISIINIYAPNKEKEQIFFLNDISNIIQKENLNNAIYGGDWNITQNATLDKYGGILYTKRSLAKLQEFMTKNDLVDVWRMKNDNLRRYTWRQKSPKICCRLDYFLISTVLMDFVQKSQILPSILSDHSPVLLTLKFINESAKGSGHWKLNVSLLENENYVREIKSLIDSCTEKYKDLQNLNVKWELVKYEIRKFSIYFGKNQKKKACG